MGGDFRIRGIPLNTGLGVVFMDRGGGEPLVARWLEVQVGLNFGAAPAAREERRNSSLEKKAVRSLDLVRSDRPPIGRSGDRQAPAAGVEPRT